MALPGKFEAKNTASYKKEEFSKKTDASGIVFHTLSGDLFIGRNEDAVVMDFEKVKLLEGNGVGITAPGKEYDCVSRFFDPKLKVNEDPVTGSVHCMITPYWAARPGKKKIHAFQAQAEIIEEVAAEGPCGILQPADREEAVGKSGKLRFVAGSGPHQ